LTLYYRTNYKASEKLRELFSFQESREPPLLQLSVREGLFLCYSETQARMTKIESQTLFKKKIFLNLDISEKFITFAAQSMNCAFFDAQSLC